MTLSSRTLLGPHRTTRRARARTPFLALVLALGACNSDGSSSQPNQPNPPLLGGATESATTAMFSAIGKSIGTQVGNQLTGWLMGQLGIASTDPSLNELQTIASTLEDIDSKLTNIGYQLNDILTEQLIQTCQLLSSDISDQLGHLDNLLTTYNTFVCTANGTCPGNPLQANVPQTELSAFADLVLSGGTATGELPVSDILTNINQHLQSGPNGGILAACIATISKPANGATDDRPYYDQVAQLTDYYYYYQTVGLLLYVEAQRYKIYELVGSPDYTQYSAGQIQEICAQAGTLDPTGEATLRCNQTNVQIQTIYSNLQRQYLLAGAPYGDDDFVFRYDATAPSIFVGSLEEFSIAAGEDCSAPLLSDSPCNTVLRAFYDSDNSAITGVLFRNKTGWEFASTADLTMLMTGWSSGTAGSHLEAIGFQDMAGKVLLGDTTFAAAFYNNSSRNHSPILWTNTVTAVPFVDTDIAFGANVTNALGSQGIRTMPTLDNTTWNSYGLMTLTDGIHGSVSQSNVSPRTFQKFTGNISNWPTWGSWSPQPGWMAANRSDNAKQFRIPMLHIANLPVASGRSAKNVAGVWTMHGADFDAWFESIAPAPQF